MSTKKKAPHVLPIRSADTQTQITWTETRMDHPVWRRNGSLLFQTPFPQGWYLPIKLVVEWAMALFLLVFTAPVILAAGILVKLTSRGPVFYSQARLGKDSRLFLVHKLRTMYHQCEKHTGPQWSRPGDPRVTPLGRFLRRTHIDELPQLWNILKGDMSLVGPRPERPEFLPGLEKAIPHYRDRLEVRPGLTGLAQVQLPPDTDLASVRRKLSCDLYYIEHMSPWLDFRLILATGMYVIGIPVEFFRLLLGLPGHELVERHYHHHRTKAFPAFDVQSRF